MKTGTLTQNLMQFLRCSIDGIIYGEAFTDISSQSGGLSKEQMAEQTRVSKEMFSSDMGDNPYCSGIIPFFDRRFYPDLRNKDNKSFAIHQFFLALAICHDILAPEIKADGVLEYFGQSPDEVALVEGARNSGFAFKNRTSGILTVLVITPAVSEKKFQVLHMLEFDSFRKRMSVIVKNDDGHILLICKGADNVLSKFLCGGQDEVLNETKKHLHQFANEGLRSLYVAQRFISQDEYDNWLIEYNQAAKSLDNRTKNMHQVYEKIEKDLKLLGCTAVEGIFQ